MKSPFTPAPLCEVCKQELATTFAHFDLEPPGKQWKFCGDCTIKNPDDRKTEDYYVSIDTFFQTPQLTIHWLAHLNRKSWMNWPDFMDMIDRFHNATLHQTNL